MALLNLVKNFINVDHLGGRVANHRIVSAVRPRFIKANSKQEARACEKASNKGNEKTKNGCDSTKEKPQKTEDSVADDPKEAIIKENAEKIKQSMNNKNW